VAEEREERARVAQEEVLRVVQQAVGPEQARWAVGPAVGGREGVGGGKPCAMWRLRKVKARLV
jgi:hypothetical protein